jgi:hypothetical protein
LVYKPEGKRPLRSPRRWLMDNIKIYLRGKGWDGVDRIHLAQETSCEHGNEPSGSIKCCEVLEWLYN